MSNPLDMFN